MGKTVYSLVLADDVVALIDSLAAREGYSRSALVNHILAQYVNLTTPEQAIRQMVDALRGITDACGLRAITSNGSTLTLKTALPYKYNPALSYSVELRGEAPSLGQLRISVRSQNGRLLAEMEQFFELWQALESTHLGLSPGAALRHDPQKGYQRALRRPAGTGNDELGLWVGEYIHLLDDCLKMYFGAEAGAQADRDVKDRFMEGLVDFGGIIQI